MVMRRKTSRRASKLVTVTYPNGEMVVMDNVSDLASLRRYVAQRGGVVETW